MHAFYEPLHERLAWLRPADIAGLRPDAWASNHSQTAPYFQEYGALLRQGVSGVPLYNRRFAFDRFFLAPDDDDPELEAYLHTLLASAGPGRATALKFCRSLGRVGWMERRFPHMLHAVLLRDPASQFASAQALLAGQRNRYFSVAPLMVLASNAAHPLVRQANAALGVRPPALLSHDLAYVTETCWRHFRRLGPSERYRQFLAYWAVTGLQALQGEALVIEPGRLVHDAAYRLNVEDRLRSVAGGGLSLASRAGAMRDPRPQARLPTISPAELAEAHLAACVLIRACGGGLAAERGRMLLGLLDDDSPARPFLAASSPLKLAAWIEPRHVSGGPLRRLATLALVLSARALQPVRRLHGRIVRWQNRLPGRSADQIT